MRILPELPEAETWVERRWHTELEFAYIESGTVTFGNCEKQSLPPSPPSGYASLGIWSADTRQSKSRYSPLSGTRQKSTAAPSVDA